MNRFSKTIYLTILALVMVFVFAGCKTATVETGEPVEVAVPAPEEPAKAETAQATETPAAEAPAVKAEEPVVKAEEPAAVAEPETITQKYSLFGYEISVKAGVGRAEITYPAAVITESDIAALVNYAVANYGAVLKDVTYEAKNGVLVLTYPKTWGEAEFNMAANDVMKYVAMVTETPVEESPIETAEQTKAPDVITRTISLYGYEATVTCERSLDDRTLVITYPSFITNAEIAQAAKAAYAAYGKYLEGTALYIDNGKATLTFPVSLTEDDIDYAVAILKAELPTYVASMFTQEAPAAEAQEVAVVAEEPKATVEEAPVAPAATQETTTTAAPSAETTTTAPAATETRTTTTTTTSAPASTASTASTATGAAAAASAAKDAAKKSGGNGGLIVVIIVLIAAIGAAAYILLKKKKK